MPIARRTDAAAPIRPAASARLPARSDSRARLERIIEAAIDLLEQRALADITLSMIAARAGIPRTSIYNFFPTAFAVFEDVARRYVSHAWSHVRDGTARRAPVGIFALMDASVEAAAEYFNAFGAARKTLLGSVTLELDVIESDFDIMGARLFREFHDPDWGVAALSDEDPYRIVALLQLSLYSASVRQHGVITPAMVRQAKLVSRAYFTVVLEEMRKGDLVAGGGGRVIGTP